MNNNVCEANSALKTKFMINKADVCVYTMIGTNKASADGKILCCGLMLK